MKRISSIKRLTVLFVLLFVLCLLFAHTAVLPSANISSAGNGKKIALTFDDGPGDFTGKLLDGLEKYNAKASFFVLGKKVSKYSDIINRMYADGHLIGNHTYYHNSLFEISVDEFNLELEKTDSELEAIIGTDTEFFRPPHGWYTSGKLEKIDKIPVLWTNDPADWKYQNEEYVYKYLLFAAHNNAVILLHDTKETTVNAVLRAIPVLQERGYEFVRADEIIS